MGEPVSALFPAATVAQVVLEFEFAALAPHRRVWPAAVGQLSADWFAFLPDLRPVPRAELPEYLATLPSPALLVPSACKGMIALALLAELKGERRRMAKHVFDNFLRSLATQLARYSLADESLLSLEITGRLNASS